MSTKAIREALAMCRSLPLADVAMERIEAAQAEVEAIEKAACTLEAESLRDFVYDVRERAAEDKAFTGNTWEHPRTVAFGEAAQVITTIAKEATP